MEERGQVSLHLGVRVFLDQETGRGVLDEERQKARSRHPVRHLPREFVEAGSSGFDLEHGLHLGGHLWLGRSGRWLHPGGMASSGIILTAALSVKPDRFIMR